MAAALAPAAYAARDAAGARLLLAVRADDLAADVGEAQRHQVRELRRRLTALVTRLAVEVWGSEEPPATTLVAWCVVDLPSALLLAGDRVTDPLAHLALERAVRGVLAGPPRLPG